MGVPGYVSTQIYVGDHNPLRIVIEISSDCMKGRGDSFQGPGVNDKKETKELVGIKLKWNELKLHYQTWSENANSQVLELKLKLKQDYTNWMWDCLLEMFES